jgi:NAD(P)-dependent dehydrogenase (short-subunit alcohol dehydrogenase family)
VRALVTGGLSGIGAAVSRRLADGGYEVIATAVDAGELESSAGRFEKHLLDVTDSRQVERFCSRVGSLDALVNCAGIGLGSPAEHTEAGFMKVLEVNLAGTMRVCYALKDALFRARGCVVNIASMLSFFGSANAPGYSAAKGGVVQLTKSLAIAWAQAGVRVNAVAPGWIVTPLTAPVRADAARERAIVERTPMRRWGVPDDVAGAVLFLCSKDAGFITGAVLPVDGGYSVA